MAARASPAGGGPNRRCTHRARSAKADSVSLGWSVTKGWGGGGESEAGVPTSRTESISLLRIGSSRVRRLIV